MMEEKLDDIIGKIESLKKGLSAEKVDYFEKVECGEWVCDGYCTGSRYMTWTEDQPVYVEDKEKREEARAGLEQLYCSSDWYSARYKAGMALGMSHERLKEDLKRWKAVLKKDLRLPKTELESVGRTMYTASDYAGKEYGAAVEVPDFKLVKNYENIQKISKAREDMKGLGYSNIDLFALRHPIAATITAVTAVSSAGYALFNYIVR